MIYISNNIENLTAFKTKLIFVKKIFLQCRD